MRTTNPIIPVGRRRPIILSGGKEKLANHFDLRRLRRTRLLLLQEESKGFILYDWKNVEHGTGPWSLHGDHLQEYEVPNH